VLTWLLRNRPHFIRHAIFVDPICFLLHHPDVAYNFVYRQPETFVDWLQWWFASRELYVTWTLNRCFYWYQNILFPRDIPRWCQTSVFIGGQDRIVPGEKVCNYLLEEAAGRNGGGAAAKVVCDGQSPVQLREKSPFTVYFYPGMNHAQFLFHPQIEEDLVACSVMGFKLQEFRDRDDEGYQTSDSHRSALAAIDITDDLKPFDIDDSADGNGDSIKTRLRSWKPRILV
jgi:hypothetical protein